MIKNYEEAHLTFVKEARSSTHSSAIKEKSKSPRLSNVSKRVKYLREVRISLVINPAFKGANTLASNAIATEATHGLVMISTVCI